MPKLLKKFVPDVLAFLTYIMCGWRPHFIGAHLFFIYRCVCICVCMYSIYMQVPAEARREC